MRSGRARSRPVPNPLDKLANPGSIVDVLVRDDHLDQLGNPNIRQATADGAALIGAIRLQQADFERLAVKAPNLGNPERGVDRVSVRPEFQEVEDSSVAACF